MHKKTFHLATVEKVEDLPEPVAEARALITGEKSVYVTEEKDGKLAWIFSVKLG